MSLRRPLVLTALVALALVSCDAPSSPLLQPEVIGVYTLESFDGVPVGARPGIEEGMLSLLPTGRALRRITHVDAGGTRSVLESDGTFTVAGDRLHLSFDEGEHRWRPPSTLIDGAIVLRYPSPADGPDIIERYARR